MKTIILTILALIIYDIIKKGINILIIKKNKDNLNKIINEFVNNKKINKDDPWLNDNENWRDNKWI